MLEQNCFFNQQNMTIATRKWIIPNYKAVIIILHGFGENSEKYNSLAEKLTKYQFIVCSFDYRGHGLSEGQVGYIHNYKNIISDAEEYFLKLRTEFDTVFFLLGHSLGGNIAIHLAMKYEFSGVYLSTPMLEVRHVNCIHKFLISSLGRMIPTYTIPSFTVVSKFTTRRQSTMRFGSVNNLFNACHKLKNSKITFPFMLTFATDDKICQIDKLYEFYDTATSSRKNICVYDNLGHNLLFNSDEVLLDMINYFNWSLE